MTDEIAAFLADSQVPWGSARSAHRRRARLARKPAGSWLRAAGWSPRRPSAQVSRPAARLLVGVAASRRSTSRDQRGRWPNFMEKAAFREPSSAVHFVHHRSLFKLLRAEDARCPRLAASLCRGSEVDE